MAKQKRTADRVRAEISTLNEKAEELREQRQALGDQINSLANQAYAAEQELRDLLKGEAPFSRGDVVADEFGVQYRVTTVDYVMPGVRGANHGEWIAHGIRLSKTGVEAHVNSRRIQAPIDKLSVV